MDLSIEPCLYCLVGFHYECSLLEEHICCCDVLQNMASQQKRGGPVKADEDITDPHSTGRKRAAVLYPIEDGMICEWAKLKFACGGKFPIVGCIGNPATHRHHGPDKNTLNNEVGNVHRICVHCHNRWHTRNDPVYETLFNTDEWLSHDAETIATDEEIFLNEVQWSSRKVSVPDDE